MGCGEYFLGPRGKVFFYAFVSFVGEALCVLDWTQVEIDAPTPRPMEQCCMKLSAPVCGAIGASVVVSGVRWIGRERLTI